MQSEHKQQFEFKSYPIRNDGNPQENNNPFTADENETDVTDQVINSNGHNRSAKLEEILQAIFMADHDAAQLEQYLLEKDSQNPESGS